MLKGFERCRLRAYIPVAGDVPTIGWGATRHPDGRPVKLGDRWTSVEADTMLALALAENAVALAGFLDNAATTQSQFDALLSLGYNIGMHALGGSALLDRHRAADYDAASRHFIDWRFVKGHPLAGLVHRRNVEAACYRGEL